MFFPSFFQFLSCETGCSKFSGDWGLGIRDWGLGIGDWGLGIGLLVEGSIPPWLPDPPPPILELDGTINVSFEI